MKKRAILILLVLLTVFSMSVTLLAADQTARLYDEADLLTDAEENTILDRLNGVSEKYKVDVIIATVETVGDSTVDEFVEDFYDRNGCGYGNNKDGVILLISMEERDYRILSNGLGAEAIGTDDIKAIGDAISSDLTARSYAKAFGSFIDECEYLIDGEINGFPFAFVKNLLISVVIGFLASFIVTGMMRRKLKSVRGQREAADYMKKGSMNLRVSRDTFLYRNVTRTKKENKSSSDSDSNTGGGKF